MSKNGSMLEDGVGRTTRIWRREAIAEELLAVDRYTIYRAADEHADLIDSHTEGDSFRNVEVEWRAKDGAPIVVRLNGRALPRQSPPVYVTIAQDITGERALEEQLRHKHKMEAIGRLAGGVAHDFNNLLTVILGRADALIHRNGGDETPVEAREILMASERAAALTQQLLAFSRKNVTEPRRTDVNDIVRNVEPMLASLVSENHTVGVECSANLGIVLADAGNLEQALVNLVLNARDAMPDGGPIVVRTGNRELAADDPSGARPGTYVSMSVTDRGVGMDEETRRRLFEPFFTTKPIGNPILLSGRSVSGAAAFSRPKIEGFQKRNGGSLRDPVADLPRLKNRNGEHRSDNVPFPLIQADQSSNNDRPRLWSEFWHITGCSA